MLCTLIACNCRLPGPIATLYYSLARTRTSAAPGKAPAVRGKNANERVAYMPCGVAGRPRRV